MEYKDRFANYININGNTGVQFNSVEGNAVINAVQNNYGSRKQKVKIAEELNKSHKKIEIFISYCWKDDKVADTIEVYLSSNHDIRLHRDKLDIGTWKSIKEYMQSIVHMDYIILLISDHYLKSENCMYEVLEVMRDRAYKDKIFPAVINMEIYDPVIQAGYVLYWQNKYNELEIEVKKIGYPDAGRLVEDLKCRRDISSNMVEFLKCVSDMNNPCIEDVCEAIEQKLKEENIII